MKPFNLEEAKAGKPVCTRDGRNARIICFDLKHEYFPLIALIDDGDRELVSRFCADGRIYYRQNGSTCLDLFMAPEKHEGFVWLARNFTTVTACAFTYKTKEEALSHKPGGEEFVLAKVEWEE